MPLDSLWGNFAGELRERLLETNTREERFHTLESALLQRALRLFAGHPAVGAKAIAAGGKSLREVKNEFYGDRSGGVQDPCGNDWWIATHVEDVSREELERRFAAMGQQH